MVSQWKGVVAKDRQGINEAYDLPKIEGAFGSIT